MTRLDSKKILEENQTKDPTSITCLKLTHKALSDVSCLSDFKNLERLDLSFNNLSSLEGLRSCTNLKWLSVSQNKLQNLRGIENLTRLTVLNASMNKLKSIDEVRSLISLRALILNDNQISVICRLDQLKELNTLVLSRNPIREIGDALVKLKSMTKLSLSNCQLQTIGTSFSPLLNLKEFRLAHNEITTLPAELAHNEKLQNLDFGNNLVTKFSDLKVSTLRGTLVVGFLFWFSIEMSIKTLVPDLQIFNSRPIERSKKNKSFEKASESDMTNEVTNVKEKEGKIKGSSNNEMSSVKHRKEDNSFDTAEAHDVESKVKRKASKTNTVLGKDVLVNSKDDAEVKGDLKRQKMVQSQKDLNKQKKKGAEEIKLGPIDDGETSFAELVLAGVGEVDDAYGKKLDRKAIQDINKLGGGIVTLDTKKKKTSKSLGKGHSALQFLSPAAEVGMGGPSTWGD
ncbi:hypothetical protein IFM89_014593 [Coptis chinensis]|uniref:Uncharacterized protein n=1 Tax=Coptis chinensis TaxID=261450 RepID=A0A835LMJ2_9MAGN|nr:hypothetical protein IFM89_014593 [Coptis chinensis]